MSSKPTMMNQIERVESSEIYNSQQAIINFGDIFQEQTILEDEISVMSTHLESIYVSQQENNKSSSSLICLSNKRIIAPAYIFSTTPVFRNKFMILNLLKTHLNYFSSSLVVKVPCSLNRPLLFNLMVRLLPFWQPSFNSEQIAFLNDCFNTFKGFPVVDLLLKINMPLSIKNFIEGLLLDVSIPLDLPLFNIIIRLVSIHFTQEPTTSSTFLPQQLQPLQLITNNADQQIENEISNSIMLSSYKFDAEVKKCLLIVKTLDLSTNRYSNVHQLIEKCSKSSIEFYNVFVFEILTQLNDLNNSGTFFMNNNLKSWFLMIYHNFVIKLKSDYPNTLIDKSDKDFKCFYYFQKYFKFPSKKTQKKNIKTTEASFSQEAKQKMLKDGINDEFSYFKKMTTWFKKRDVNNNSSNLVYDGQILKHILIHEEKNQYLRYVEQYELYLKSIANYIKTINFHFTSTIEYVHEFIVRFYRVLNFQLHNSNNETMNLVNETKRLFGSDFITKIININELEINQLDSLFIENDESSNHQNKEIVYVGSRNLKRKLDNNSVDLNQVQFKKKSQTAKTQKRKAPTISISLSPPPSSKHFKKITTPPQEAIVTTTALPNLVQAEFDHLLTTILLNDDSTSKYVVFENFIAVDSNLIFSLLNFLDRILIDPENVIIQHAEDVYGGENDNKRLHFFPSKMKKNKISKYNTMLTDITSKLCDLLNNSSSDIKTDVKIPTEASIILSKSGCSMQDLHTDYSTEMQFNENRSYFAFVSLMEETSLVLESSEIILKPGSLLFARGDLIHAGNYYAKSNIRLHYYFDNISSMIVDEADRKTFFIEDRSHDLFQSFVSNIIRELLVNDLNDKVEEQQWNQEMFLFNEHLLHEFIQDFVKETFVQMINNDLEEKDCAENLLKEKEEEDAKLLREENDFVSAEDNFVSADYHQLSYLEMLQMIYKDLNDKAVLCRVKALFMIYVSDSINANEYYTANKIRSTIPQKRRQDIILQHSTSVSDQENFNPIYRKVNYILLLINDFCSLSPNQWLTESIFDIYATMLNFRELALKTKFGDRRSKYYFIPPIVFNSIFDFNNNYNWEISKNVFEKIKIFSCSKVFIFSNTGNLHWIVIEINVKDRNITVYDSIPKSDKVVQDNLKLKIDTLKKWLNDEEQQQDFNATAETLPWSYSVYKETIKQTNKNDCGVHAIITALFLSEDILPSKNIKLQKEDFPEKFRYKIGMDIERGFILDSRLLDHEYYGDILKFKLSAKKNIIKRKKISSILEKSDIFPQIINNDLNFALTISDNEKLIIEEDNDEKQENNVDVKKDQIIKEQKLLIDKLKTEVEQLKNEGLVSSSSSLK